MSSESAGRPRRSGIGDVIAAFVFILSLALGSQAYSDIDRYAGLRANGVTVTGAWAGRFTNPSDGLPYATYFFELDGRTYTQQQAIDGAVAYTDRGEPVQIVYLPEDPGESRIAGTEGFGVGPVLMLAGCALVAIFALQYFLAYYMGRSAWALMLLRRVTQWRDSAQGRANGQGGKA
ncbi:MAG: hypothetical protein IPK19_17570 [Chloroflexi bacterium]|nr:hypothetical protein [Chloroflexota bacterium]